LCEYCLIHEGDTFLGCEVDHIISEKHGGPTREQNLAFACLFCNRNKGSDIASLAAGEGRLVRFFHPRLDRWNDHFRLSRDGVALVPLTDIGEATIRIFGINAGERLLERDALRAVGRYPTPEARRRMEGSG
jgi:hypothetical protein